MWNVGDPLASLVDRLTTHLSIHYAVVFDTVSAVITGIEGPIEVFLRWLPPLMVVGLIVVVGMMIGGWRLATLCGMSLAFILSLDLWASAMETLALVLTATLLSLLIGIPLGILMAEFRRVTALLTPALDFMQTMPPFVLLVPAVVFFGVGMVPGVVATIFFAMPLPIRLTAHGLAMVEQEIVEAGEAFGASRLQLLALVKLPLSFRSIMAGVNQCIMMSLSMVIIASMIGAGGLGNEIFRAISRLQVGRGVNAGLAVVVLAILIDRVSKRLGGRVDPTA